MSYIIKNYGEETEGTVTFTPSITSVEYDGETYEIETVVETLDNGLLIARLEPNDVGDPQGWTYTVTESFGDTYTISVPRGTHNLDELSSAPTAPIAVLDDRIAALLADETSDAYEAAETLVEAATAAHVPGIEMGASSRTTNFTTTNTVSTNTAGNITSLSVTVVGTGRPVDVRFHVPSIYHSVANTFVSAILIRDGNNTSADNQIGGIYSTATTTGPSLTIVRRTNPLVAGTSYTFTARVWASQAGTTTLVGAAYCPIELTVTSR